MITCRCLCVYRADVQQFFCVCFLYIPVMWRRVRSFYIYMLYFIFISSLSVLRESKFQSVSNGWDSTPEWETEFTAVCVSSSVWLLKLKILKRHHINLKTTASIYIQSLILLLWVQYNLLPQSSSGFSFVCVCVCARVLLTLETQKLQSSSHLGF